MMFIGEVFTPQSRKELCRMLADPTARIIAGGTDILPQLRRNPASDQMTLVDLSRLGELNFIRDNNGQIEIGATTPHSKLISSALLIKNAPALIEACASIGSIQTRNRGTLGGNLCNASPAADSVGALLCLDAEVSIANATSLRQVPLSEFIISPGKTCLQSGEFLDHITFSVPEKNTGASFIKLGRRNGMSIAVASASVLLRIDSAGVIKHARIALGSVAPKVVRSAHAEAILMDKPASTQLFTEASKAVLEDINPIDDVRASKAYRSHTASVLVFRALEAAYNQARMEAL